MTVARPFRTGAAARPGMTLIEVLLALAILLMATVAIIQLMFIGADRAVEAKLQSDGTRLAQSKMAEVESGVISPTGGGSGNFDGDDSNWTWTVDSSPGTLPNLYAITVTVTHDFLGKPLTVVLSQLVFDPAYMGTAAMIPNPTTGTTSSGTTGTTTSGGTSP